MRLLAEWSGPQHDDAAAVNAAAQSFAERLGQWLNWTDAIALSSALSSAPSSPPSSAPSSALARSSPIAARSATSPAPAAVAAERDIESTCAALQQHLARELAAASAEFGATPADFAPLRRHMLASQRAMENAIGPLRARLRALIAAQSSDRSAPLAQLAALDAVLDTALAARERAVLAAVPGLLEEHHARLRKAQADEAGDAPSTWTARLNADARADVHAALQAELELRLQPALGLQQALAQAAAATADAKPIQPPLRQLTVQRSETTSP